MSEEFTTEFRRILNDSRYDKIPVIQGRGIEACNIIEQLQAELDKYKPKPLLFSCCKLFGFTVIVNEDMPKNQIWFATHEQLGEALEFSRKYIEQVLEGKRDE